VCDRLISRPSLGRRDGSGTAEGSRRADPPELEIGTRFSFFFLYPATTTLLEIPALASNLGKRSMPPHHRSPATPRPLGPRVLCRVRPTMLWDRSSFTLGHCAGLIAHSPVPPSARAIGAWLPGPLRPAFALPSRANTSVLSVRAVLDGRQSRWCPLNSCGPPAGHAIAIGRALWSHR